MSVIVKVQLPLESNVREPRALIYSKDKSIHCLVLVDEDILIAMDGNHKQFFYVDETRDVLDGKVTALGATAPWQEW